MKVKPKISVLKKKADAVFSIYIRNRDRGRCITCGKVLPVRAMQCGHYVSRRYNITRFDEMNCNCQCYSCNVCRHGDMITYREQLVLRYGEDRVKLLEQSRHTVCKMDDKDYQQIIDTYTAKLTRMGVEII